MGLDRTRERLSRLGPVHAADRLVEHMSEAVREIWPPHRSLDYELVLRDE